MTLPAYPKTLPLPQLTNYSLSPVDNTISTPTATGHTIQRTVAPNAPTRMSATWRLSSEEAALLEGWVEALDGGYFLMPVKVPMGVLDHQVRVLGRVRSMQPLSATYWDIAATVEIRKPQRMPPEFVAVLAEFSAKDIRAAVSPLHTLIHVDLPDGQRW